MRMLLDTFAQTLRTLWAHKLRSFLTMFGIAWGVGSLLLLAGVGEGFRNGNRKQLETFGKNIIFFFGGRAPAVEGSFNSMKWFNLTYDDYLAIKNESKLAHAIFRRSSRVTTFARSATTPAPTARSPACLPSTARCGPSRWRSDAGSTTTTMTSADASACLARNDAQYVSGTSRSRQHHPAEWRSLRGHRRALHDRHTKSKMRPTFAFLFRSTPCANCFR